MKGICLVFVMFFLNSMFAQKKEFVPKTGQIAFVRTETINEINNFNKNLHDSIINQVLTYHHVFKSDLIVSYKSFKNIIYGNYNIIDTKTGLTNILSKKDSSTIFLKNQPFYDKYSKGIIINISEDHNDTKNIKGYDCFKVNVTITKNVYENDFLSPTMSKKYHLYVTDKIKCIYHPVPLPKEVLMKYYPLEIIELMDPMRAEYTVSSFTLK
jgi:hypothetical protein